MQIITSQATRELIKDDFTLSDLGEHKVRGFDSVTLFSLDDEHAGIRR